MKSASSELPTSSGPGSSRGNCACVNPSQPYPGNPQSGRLSHHVFGHSVKKLKVHVIKSEHRHSQADKVNYTLGGRFFNAAGMALVIPINSPWGLVYRELKAFCSERKTAVP